MRNQEIAHQMALRFRHPIEDPNHPMHRRQTAPQLQIQWMGDPNHPLVSRPQWTDDPNHPVNRNWGQNMAMSGQISQWTPPECPMNQQHGNMPPQSHQWRYQPTMAEMNAVRGANQHQNSGYQPNRNRRRSPVDSGEDASMDTEEERMAKRHARRTKMKKTTSKKKKVWVTIRGKRVLASYWESD